MVHRPRHSRARFLHLRGSADRGLVFAAILREAQLSGAAWVAPKSAGLPGAHDRFLRERAARSQDHVFALLGLVLPRAPLAAALAGLRSDEPRLRGTALEYLDGVLPAAVREALDPMLRTFSAGCWTLPARIIMTPTSNAQWPPQPSGT